MKSIFFLSSATLHVLSGLVDPGPLLNRDKTRLSCTAAVCVRDNGDIVLIDAGLGSGLCRSGDTPEGRLSPLTRRLFGISPDDIFPIVNQLEQLGFDRGDVKAVVATHCHFDHIGGLSDFPNAELITTPDELNALGGCGFSPFCRPADLVVENPIRPVSLTGPRKYAMPASFDLFGDGEITLLDAEGHSPGHIAVALHTSDTFYLHVGDALFLDWESGRGWSGPSRLSRAVCCDSHAMRRTLRSIQRLSTCDDPPIIVPAHDIGIFETLPHTPEAGKIEA